MVYQKMWALLKVLKAFYGMETDLSRRKEDWAELNKIDLEQFYKLRLYEQKLFAMGNPGPGLGPRLFTDSYVR